MERAIPMTKTEWLEDARRREAERTRLYEESVKPSCNRISIIDASGVPVLPTELRAGGYEESEYAHVFVVPKRNEDGSGFPRIAQHVVAILIGTIVTAPGTKSR